MPHFLVPDIPNLPNMSASSSSSSRSFPSFTAFGSTASLSKEMSFDINDGWLQAVDNDNKYIARKESFKVTLSEPEEQHEHRGVVSAHIAVLHELVESQFDLIFDGLVEFPLFGIKLTIHDLNLSIRKFDEWLSVQDRVFLPSKHDSFQYDL